MVKRVLIILFLVTTLQGTGCAVDEEIGLYQPVELTPQLRQGIERSKREFLQLEDIMIGNGPIAAWGRKVSADIEVRYVDGTLIYRGPAFDYIGLKGTVFIHNSVRERGILSLQQRGIILGLNGMAVGGKRRMTIAPNLVCYEGVGGESIDEGTDPRKVCSLLESSSETITRKETLIVEATLTASCIPGFSGIPRVLRWESRCRSTEIPRRDPSDPIWHA